MGFLLVDLGKRLEGWEKKLGLHIDFVSGFGTWPQIYTPSPPSLRLCPLTGMGRRWLSVLVSFFNICHTYLYTTSLDYLEDTWSALP